MSIKIDSIEKLREYFKEVVKRGDHHGQPVKEILFPLVGFILAYSDADSEIWVKEYTSEAKNTLWVYINQKRYAFSYDHKTYKIDVREGGIQGKDIFEINNNTTYEELKIFFTGLVG